MKFCVKCGNKLDDNDMFCPKCGHKCEEVKKSEKKDDVQDTKKLEDTQSFDTGSVDETNNDYQNEINNNNYQSEGYFEEDELPEDSIFDRFKRKIVSSKKIIGISILGVLCVVLIILSLVGNAMSKPSNAVSEFQKAVASGDKKQLADVLYCSDNRLKIDEKSVEPLVNYLKDNPSYLNQVVSGLNNDVAKADGNKDILKMNQFDSKSKFNVIYAGKKYLFFKEYKIGVKPCFISLKTKIKDVQFSLNNTQVAKSDSKDFSKQVGPFIPAKYKLAADYKNSFESLNDSHDVDFVDSNDDNVSIEAFKDASYINIDSQYPEAEIFLNNKDTGIKAKDAGNFGPLAANSVIYGVTTVNGQKLRSSDYALKADDNYAKLDFTQSQNDMQIDEDKIRNLIYWYTNYFSQAVNSGDFDILKDYLYPGSSLYNAQKSYVATTYEKGIKEDIRSFNVTSYTLSDDKKSGTVSTEEVYDIYQNDDVTPSTKTFHYTYTFMYNEEFPGYQLSSIK